MADEREKRLLSYVFGDSDSEEGKDDDRAQPMDGIDMCLTAHHTWEENEEIPGLWLCKGFISNFQQKQLLSAIQAEGWFSHVHNQAMRFKDLPRWALQLSNLIYEATCSYCMTSDSFRLYSSSQALDLPLNLDILGRVPLFDQMIVNIYEPGEGICAHVDLMRFEDGIAIVSLESSCVMHFSWVDHSQKETAANSLYDQQLGHISADKQHDTESSHIKEKVPILLEPGDLLLMSGEARYKWAHEIKRSEGCQVWNGQTITQKRRTSVTLRKLAV